MARNKPEYKNPMKVINLANDLCAVTLQVLCNEKIFPKKSRWLLSGKMADLVNGFHNSIHLANEIKVTTKQEALDRHRYQTLALAHLQALEEKMELAKIVLCIDVNRVEKWAGMWNEEKKLLTNWISKDEKRYADLLR